MFINVTEAANPRVYCNFLYMDGTCVNPYRSPNCYCEPVTSDYRIIISFTGLHGETWRLASELANSSAMITETVTITVKPNGKLCCLCHCFTSLGTNEQRVTALVSAEYLPSLPVSIFVLCPFSHFIALLWSLSFFAFHHLPVCISRVISF